MKINSVSMRRWFLHGAIPCGLVNVINTNLATLFLCVWMFFGMLRNDNDVNCCYKRKTGPMRECARAFLVLSFSVVSLRLLEWFSQCMNFHNRWTGNVFAFFLPIMIMNVAEYLLRNRFSNRVNWIAGLLCLCMMLGL